MAVSGVLLLSVLLFLLKILTSDAVSYVDYDIASDKVCSRLGKRELSISMTRPLIVREGGRLLSNWPGVHSFTCRWEVEAKGRGIGVVAVVQKLKIRKLGSECVDYIQTTNTTIYRKSEIFSGGGKKFKIKKTKKKGKERVVKLITKSVKDSFKEDSESNRGPRVCGSMLFGMHLYSNGSLPHSPPGPIPPTPPTTPSTALSILSTFLKGAYNHWSSLVPHGATVDPKGELKTYVYIANRPLYSGDTLELVVAYTGFQVCDGRSPEPGLFHCGYGLCISNLLVNDGVVNCPFKDCIDEISCNDAKVSNLTAWILGHSTARISSSGSSAGVTATSSFFGIAILLTIGACICFIMRKNKQRKSGQRTETTTEYPQTNGIGEYVGIPTTAANQNMGPQGQPMNSQGQPMMPPGGVPPGQPMPPPQGGNIGFFVPGAPAPYSTIGTPYPGTGAPYPPVGTPYPGGNAPYPGGNNAPYPVQSMAPPAQPPSADGTQNDPSAPFSQEPPPQYNSLFPNK